MSIIMQDYFTRGEGKGKRRRKNNNEGERGEWGER